MKLVMKKMTSCIGVLAFAALIPFAEAATVQNLFQYGDFEGVVTPGSNGGSDTIVVTLPKNAWNVTLGGDIGTDTQGYKVHNKNFALKFYSSGDNVDLKAAHQDVVLNGALKYRLDFHLFGETAAEFEGFGLSSDLKAVFEAGGDPRIFGFKDLMREIEMGLSNDGLDVPGWTHFFLDGIIGSGTKSLGFSSDGSSTIFVDDVSLICTSDSTACNAVIPDPTNVPEPGTLLLVGAALAAAGVTARRRKQA